MNRVHWLLWGSLAICCCASCIDRPSTTTAAKNRSTFTSIGDYKKTVRSARNNLPVALQMEKMFAVVDHFITHNAPYESYRTWNTVAYFGGRYILTMQQQVDVDYARHMVTAVGPPTFTLSELLRVDQLPDGRVSGRFGSQTDFTMTTWHEVWNTRNIVEVEFSWKATSVPGFDTYVKAWRNDRVPVSLLNQAELADEGRIPLDSTSSRLK